MSDEDWDAEIEGTAPVKSKLQTLSINQNTHSPSSKYFDDDYKNDSRSDSPSFGGFGSHVSFEGGRGRGRGRDRGYGRGFSNFNGGENSNWRDNQRRDEPTTRIGFDTRQNGFHNGRTSGTSDEPLVMIVLTEKVGKIIGKGGSKIKEIQAESGARVKVIKDANCASDTNVEIYGTKEQKENAERLIRNLTSNVWGQSTSHQPETPQVEQPPQRIDWNALKQLSVEFEKAKFADCPDIKKNFYRENKEISNMDPLDVASLRMSKNNITVADLSTQNRHIPNPIKTFEDAFEDFPEILDTIRQNKFTEPSPIQSQAWPVLLSGMDCIGIAQTGTGKTLAFLLPAFIHIDEQITPRRERGGPTCLVLSPTRELAQQIEMEVKKFHYRGIRSICIYGGGDRREQINLVKQGVEIIIGTPGRLNDLLMNKFFQVKSVTYLVLDEADRMLDMGFEPEIKKILLDIRPDRQTIMTSATWPPEVQRMADQYLRDPVRVNVGSLDLQACHSVTQLVEFIETENKQARLIEFVNSMGPDDKLIVFVGRKSTADDISSNFAMYGEHQFGIQSIHGDRDQADREQALEDMKTGEARVLIATDVASRGLDIKDLTHVLNYDFPRHIEDYVHRIGRTGRAGRSGCALTFVTREDWMHVGKLIPILEEAGQEVPEELIEMADRARKSRERRLQEKNRERGMCGDKPRSGCYNCGKEGHMSRECPERSGRGGRGRRGRERGGGIGMGGIDFA